MDAASYFLKLSNERSLYLSSKIDIGKVDLLCCSNDNLLVVFSLRNYYCLFSTQEGKIVKTWQDAPPLKIHVSSKNFVIYQTQSKEIKILNFNETTPKTIASNITLAEFNDKFLINLTESNKLTVINLDVKSNPLSITLPENFIVEDIVLKNKVLLIGKLDNRVSFVIFSIQSGDLSQPKAAFNSSNFIGSSDDLEYLVFRSENLGLNIINTTDPSKSYNILFVDSKANRAFFSKDKTLLAITDFDEYISFWWTNKKLNTNNEPIFKQKICGEAAGLTFSDNGNVSSLITYKNNFLKIWLPTQKQDRLPLHSGFKPDESYSFSHNGYFLSSIAFPEKDKVNCLFIKPRWESKIVKFDLFSPSNINDENTFKESLVNFGTLSKNSKLLAILRDKKKIKIINTQSNSVIQEFAVKDCFIDTITFTSDQRFLILAGTTLKIWSIDKEIFVKSLSPEIQVDHIVVSSDNKLIAFSQKIKDKTLLRIMDIDSKEIKRTFEGLNHINSLIFSPNSKFLFIGSKKSDPQIRAYSVETGNLVFSYQIPYIDVNDLSISSNGTCLFFGGSDEKIYVLDLRKNKIVKILNGHYDIIRKIYISDDDRTLISSSDDERLCFWKVIDYV